MADQTRILPIPGVKNFRDMGGYTGTDGRKIGWGRIYRSGHLSEFGGNLATTPQPYRIGTVVDFRSVPEKERNPVRWPEGWAPAYHPTPIGGNAAAWVKDLYERLSNSPFPAKDLRDQFILAFETIPVANAAGLRSFFETLANSDPAQAVLFHCTAGKDRTGIAGALLMKTLGTHDDDIMADFLLTNDAVDLKAASSQIAEKLSEKAGRAIAPTDVLPLVGVEEAFLHAAYASIEKEFGSLEAYMQDTLGLSPARQEKLKSLFLES